MATNSTTSAAPSNPRGGSIYNINTIKAGELDFGVAQSDWQYHAYNGTSKFKDAGAFKDLRAVFSVHPEPFTDVARADAGIKNIQDLKGKRVNIGNPGSGQRGTMEVLMGKMGWNKGTFKLASELKSAEQSQALCDNKIDAMVFTVGHPSGSIKEATTSCSSVLVNVTGPAVDALVKENSFYRKATIPGGMYTGSPNDTQTFGVGATFVSSTKGCRPGRLRSCESGVREFRPFQEASPGVPRAEGKGNDQRRSFRAAARWCCKVLQRKGLDVI